MGILKPAGTEDSQPEPLSGQSRRFLLGYLLILALGLAIVLVALWSMEFPDAVFLRQAPDLSGEGPAGAGHPSIAALDPVEVAAGSAQPMLTIYGYHFTDKSKVLLNAAERSAKFVNPHTLLITMLPADTAQPGPLTVTVAEGDVSASQKLAVLSPARVLGPFKLLGWAWQINEETRLVLLVLFAGALGAYVHGIKSLVDYIGNGTARQSWFWFYISRPFLGMALAVIFYAVIRGGFLAGTPADAKSVNPFGAVALAGMVGMFSDKATQKLAELFEVMFRTTDTRKNKLSELEITTETLGSAVAGKPYSHTLEARGGQGGYTWSVTGQPPDLHLNPATGLLSWATPAVGEYKMQVTVKDRAGASKDREYTLAVAGPAA